jgi:hypothetical protein
MHLLKYKQTKGYGKNDEEIAFMRLENLYFLND